SNMINDEDSAKQMKRTKAIIQSMTPYERAHPDTIRSSMKRRIASGSGTTVNDVNKLLNQYEKMKTAMNAMTSLSKSGKLNENFLDKLMNQGSKANKPSRPKYRLK
ncbi:MAG: signal recognition particle protein, partial [Erysipelotrichaceae bacterium]|nr:signal recognition particle protein [Erysipelotrichaceae bacterium]